MEKTDRMTTVPTPAPADDAYHPDAVEANDVGSLEPGKLADLQVLDQNPLEDIHRTTSIRYIMKNGRLYRAEDLTEVWPRQQPLPPIYVWNDSTKSPTLSSVAAAPCR